jgi:RNA polymerase sigma factor (TIGR02999 family)
MQLDAIDAPPGEVTQLLHEARHGDLEAMHRIVSLIYDDMRAIAGRKLRGEFGQRTMQPTALVHETFIKLTNGSVLRADDRAHLLAIAARAMRQVLISDARRRSAAKRAGEWERITFDDQFGQGGLSAENLLELNEALDSLDPRQRQVVECRFFGGMEVHEIAAALGLAERTVRRDWVKARAWLYHALYGGASN